MIEDKPEEVGQSAKPKFAPLGNAPEIGDRQFSPTPFESGGGAGGTEKEGGLQEEEEPADRIRTKKTYYEKVRAIAMAPHDRLGALGWAAITGIIGSLPGAGQDFYAAYFSNPRVPLTLGRQIDIGVMTVFIGIAIFAVIKRRGKTAEDLLREMFPDEEKKKIGLIRRFRIWRRNILREATMPLEELERG